MKSKKSVDSFYEICSKNGKIFFSFRAKVTKDSWEVSLGLDWAGFFLVFFAAIIKYYYINYRFSLISLI